MSVPFIHNPCYLDLLSPHLFNRWLFFFFRTVVFSGSFDLLPSPHDFSLLTFELLCGSCRKTAINKSRLTKLMYTTKFTVCKSCWWSKLRTFFVLQMGFYTHTHTRTNKCVCLCGFLHFNPLPINQNRLQQEHVWTHTCIIEIITKKFIVSGYLLMLQCIV